MGLFFESETQPVQVDFQISSKNCLINETANSIKLFLVFKHFSEQHFDF